MVCDGSKSFKIAAKCPISSHRVARPLGSYLHGFLCTSFKVGLILYTTPNDNNGKKLNELRINWLNIHIYKEFKIIVMFHEVTIYSAWCTWGHSVLSIRADYNGDPVGNTQLIQSPTPQGEGYGCRGGAVYNEGFIPEGLSLMDERYHTCKVGVYSASYLNHRWNPACSTS